MGDLGEDTNAQYFDRVMKGICVGITALFVYVTHDTTIPPSARPVPQSCSLVATALPYMRGTAAYDQGIFCLDPDGQGRIYSRNFFDGWDEWSDHPSKPAHHWVGDGQRGFTHAQF